MPPRVDPTLRFYEEVLGLSYLHYGMWEGDPATLEGLRAAQERYAERLAAWIPDGVRTVLDVGCGTGGNAMLLTARGYSVEGLSPDPFQQERFTTRTGLPFHLSRFEDFEPSRTWQLVLMSESCQYIRISRLFDAVRRAAPGGWLLVADYFVNAKGEGPLERSGHVLDGFRARASRDGFYIEREEDITEAVLPTLVLAKGWIDRYARPAVRLVSDTLGARYPWTLAVLRWMLRRRLASIAEQAVLVDGEAFRAVKSYRMFLIRVP
ncbi:MAG: methyltransferase domain-containing protein [Deltaproteobacteria bacterium]|nr:methyltransferase domain-containing protein [Deltaproteobacteria bacterium]